MKGLTKREKHVFGHLEIVSRTQQSPSGAIGKDTSPYFVVLTVAPQLGQLSDFGNGGT